jgi:hypothetical protein
VPICCSSKPRAARVFWRGNAGQRQLCARIQRRWISRNCVSTKLDAKLVIFKDKSINLTRILKARRMPRLQSSGKPGGMPRRG